LHAATIVTAGIFLSIRIYFLFELCPNTLFYLVLIGSITSLFAALCATFQYDIKKIIAYSTCSQLGYILICSGFSFYTVSLFHLFNHAFFKAILFLSAGIIIYSLADEQDIRKIGNINVLLPVIYITILVGNLALMG
jgi:NADH:ubiquinone oxidoreductase subunit 5 (subunit L)/multisubunit Na+/H+ antiporter MnhA subunit